LPLEDRLKQFSINKNLRRINAMAAAAAASAKAMPNAQKTYEVSRADLPVSCPMPDMTLWNSHPKVYLPIEATGKAKCPYCGADYVLVD
jgi:uncharacterized Zn-finger protein